MPLKDGLQLSMVQRLASIGNGGSLHAAQKLLDLLGWCGVHDQLTALEDSETSHIVLPSTVISHLHTNYNHHFKKLLGADQDLLKRCWGQFLERPQNQLWANQHPHLQGNTADQLSAMAPLAVHQDAAPYSKTLSFDAKCFSGLLGEGDENISKFLCCTCVKEKVGDEKPDRSWPALLADFLALGTGVVAGRPVAEDPDGTKWAFALLIAKGRGVPLPGMGPATLQLWACVLRVSG